jgi:energy-coupling factor transport system permease protein
MMKHHLYNPADRTVPVRFIAADPRFLLAGFLAIVISAFVVGGTAGLAFIFAYVVMLAHLAGIPAGTLIKNGRSLIFFVVLVIAINSVLVRGEPMVTGLPFPTREGLESGIHNSVRVLILYLSAVVFLSVMSPEDIARAVAEILRPLSPDLARRCSLYVFLTFGFLPLFADEIERVRTAQRFRGGGLEGGIRRKLRGVRLLLVPLFVSAIHRSGHLAMAVELRDVKTTIENILGLGSPAQRDYVFVAATLAIVAAAGFLI